MLQSCGTSVPPAQPMEPHVSFYFRCCILAVGEELSELAGLGETGLCVSVLSSSTVICWRTPCPFCKHTAGRPCCNLAAFRSAPPRRAGGGGGCRGNPRPNSCGECQNKSPPPGHTRALPPENQHGSLCPISSLNLGIFSFFPGKDYYANI